MELDPAEISRVWWSGAVKGAIKGIPQGLLLGALAGLALYAGVAALGMVGFVGAANTLATAFGSFIYSGSMASGFTFASAFNPAAIIIFNTILTSIGNFLTGGTMAVNAYKQDVEHRMNEARISQIERRELALEQQVSAPSPSIQKILAAGPRTGTNFQEAEAERAEAPSTRTLH